ncbi:MAG: YkgJ family cysteine cluster protein [Bacteroidales bacterium]
MITPEELKNKASDRKKANKELFRRIKKKKPSDLDSVMESLHHEAFSRINCLDCANCCKTISPFLIDRDIQRISKYLKIKPSEFVSEYLDLDNEGDYVFKKSPCPFLMDDNYCSIYDVRPRACREYPHTDRKRFIQILDLTLKNTFICPAVYEIADKLHSKY